MINIFDYPPGSGKVFEHKVGEHTIITRLNPDAESAKRAREELQLAVKHIVEKRNSEIIKSTKKCDTEK